MVLEASSWTTSRGRGGAHCGGEHGPGDPSEGALLPGYGNGWVTGRQDAGLQGEGQPPGHEGGRLVVMQISI